VNYYLRPSALWYLPGDEHPLYPSGTHPFSAAYAKGTALVPELPYTAVGKPDKKLLAAY
jgi:hypothetical protein